MRKGTFRSIFLLATILLVLLGLSGRYEDQLEFDWDTAEAGLAWLKEVRSGISEEVLKQDFSEKVASTSGWDLLSRRMNPLWAEPGDVFVDDFIFFLGEKAGENQARGPERPEASDSTLRSWAGTLEDLDRWEGDLRMIKAADWDETMRLAREALPPHALIDAQVHVVLGGGPAVFSEGRSIGLNLLQAPRSLEGLDLEALSRRLAVEMHHSALSDLNGSVSADEKSEASPLLLLLATEGLPAALIDQPWLRIQKEESSPDPARRAAAREWKRRTAELPKLYAEAEKDLRLAMSGEFSAGEIEAKWKKGNPSAAGVLGADMFLLIDRILGRKAALDVSRNLNNLLKVYNHAADKVNFEKGNRFVFDRDLAGGKVLFSR